MSRRIACSVFGLCLLFNAPALAAYLIKLKNGNQFITGRYWYEERQVLFESYGGIFGVDKTFVKNIERSDKPIPIAPVSVQPPEDKPTGDVKPDKNEVKTVETPIAPQDPKPEKPEEDSVRKEFVALKAQSANLSTMLTTELGEYMKKVSALKNKIQQEGKINQYIREFSELIAMADAAEAALNSRR